MKFTKKKILILSPEKWGIMKVSKHHYALELASRGNQVYFVNPPGGQKVGSRKIFNGLTVIDLPHYPMINRINIKWRKLFHRKIFKQLYKISGESKFDIVWSFDPFVLQNIDIINAELKIYHPVDLHLSHLDLEMASKADVIFCTSDAIIERYNGLDVPRYQINHGLRSEFLNTKLDCSTFPFEQGKVNICYVGNLQYRFLNFEVLSRIVNENTNVNFYFIGPESKSNFGEFRQFDYSNLKSKPNTFFMGVLESEKIAEVLGCFDGFIISYSADNPVYLSNLHKTMEFLSTGKVIVTSYTDQYKDRGDLLEMVKDIKDLPKKFKEVTKNIGFYNSEEKMKARIEFAKSNTYSNQVDKIERIVTELGF